MVVIGDEVQSGEPGGAFRLVLVGAKEWRYI